MSTDLSNLSTSETLSRSLLRYQSHCFSFAYSSGSGLIREMREKQKAKDKTASQWVSYEDLQARLSHAYKRPDK